MAAIGRILKRVLPIPVKQWIKRVIVKFAGHDPQIQAVIERSDALFQVFEQKIQRQLSDLTVQISTLQQLRAELVDRSDGLFELLEQKISRTRTAFNSDLADLRILVPGAVDDDSVASTSVTNLVRSDEYPAFQARFRGGEHLLTNRLQPHIEALRGRKRVLDIGCGDGLFLEMLHQAGIDAVGIDTNQVMVDSARQRGLNVHHQNVFAALENLEPGEYDTITALHIIEHMPATRLRQFLEHCYRVLPEGGMLLMEMPNISNLMTLTRSYFLDPTHLMPRNAGLISFVLEHIGFSDVSVYEINNYPEEEQFFQDLSVGPSDIDPEIYAGLQPVIEKYEKNFARLNTLFYSGMDVVFKATKNGV